MQTFLPYADFEPSARALDPRRLGKQRVEIRSQADLAASGELPPWLGDEGFHRSHRSSLVRKDPDFYRPLFPDVPDDLPYVWPSSS